MKNTFFNLKNTYGYEALINSGQALSMFALSTCTFGILAAATPSADF